MKPRGETSPCSGMGAVETNMIFRALAIAGVVAGHSQLFVFSGGALFLLALTGFNFRRFKLASFTRDGSPWPSTLRYQKKLLVPYVVAVLAYFTWKGVMEWDVLLLVSNLQRVNGTAIFPIWFIQVLVQCTLILAALFSFDWVRNFAARSGLFMPLIMLSVASMVSLGADTFLDLDHLYNRTPLRLFAFVALGWACAAASTLSERMIMGGVTLAFAVLVVGGGTHGCWLAVGMIAILARHEVVAPRMVVAMVNTTAKASYYIFLTHMAAFHLLGLAGVNAPSLKFAVGMTGGVAAWYALDRCKLHRIAAASIATGMEQVRLTIVGTASRA